MTRTKIFGFLTLICVVLALSLVNDLPRYLKYKNGDIQDFETVAAGELKHGDLVQGTIDFSDGYIAENEETKSTFGIETSKRTTSQYYAVYMYNEQYILYETSNKAQYSILDKLGNECDAYYESLNAILDEDGNVVGDASQIVQPTTTLQFTAVVKDTPSDLHGIFREWYGEGFDQDCEPVMMTYLDFSVLPRKVLIGGGAAVLGIIFLVITIISWRKSKQFSF